jgi:hypothetical protein
MTAFSGVAWFSLVISFQFLLQESVEACLEGDSGRTVLFLSQSPDWTSDSFLSIVLCLYCTHSKNKVATNR